MREVRWSKRRNRWEEAQAPKRSGLGGWIAVGLTALVVVPVAAAITQARLTKNRGTVRELGDYNGHSRRIFTTAKGDKIYGQGLKLGADKLTRFEVGPFPAGQDEVAIESLNEEIDRRVDSGEA